MLQLEGRRSRYLCLIYYSEGKSLEYPVLLPHRPAEAFRDGNLRAFLEFQQFDGP